MRREGKQAALTHCLRAAVPVLLATTHQGVLTWSAVEAAMTAGCHSLSDILAHISADCQPLPEQQQAAAGGLPGRVTAGTTGQAHAAGKAAGCQLPEAAEAAAGVVVPVVSREHLQRQLKLWVEEGRTVKAARNCYKLQQQCN